jgi:YHS domain-containing protein
MAEKIDPVCGQTVDPLRARAVAIVGGERYYFCSPEHKARFSEDPARYLGAARPDPEPAKPEARAERKPETKETKAERKPETKETKAERKPETKETEAGPEDRAGVPAPIEPDITPVPPPAVEEDEDDEALARVPHAPIARRGGARTAVLLVLALVLVVPVFLGVHGVSLFLCLGAAGVALLVAARGLIPPKT